MILRKQSNSANCKTNAICYDIKVYDFLGITKLKYNSYISNSLILIFADLKYHLSY